MTEIKLTVNGTTRSDEVEPRLLLVHYLRETLGLRAANVGCDTTSCGACTVLLDGESVKSCTVLAVQASGRSVTTAEGLVAEDGTMSAVQQAFLEEVVYDEDGNPLTATFADYPFLTATEVPSYELVEMETPTSYNPLGAKGIGEAGSIGATPAVQNAVIDAVSHLGVTHIDMPTSPQRVWRAINAANASKEA